VDRIEVALGLRLPHGCGFLEELGGPNAERIHEAALHLHDGSRVIFIAGDRVQMTPTSCASSPWLRPRKNRHPRG
jgi:hypothetical protein